MMHEKDDQKTLESLRHIIEDVSLEKPPRLRWIRRSPHGITGPGGCLGVFPSSFNPPTRAHSVLVEKAREIGSLDETLLILDRKPLDKEIVGASLEDRLSMILLSFQKNPTVSVAVTNRGLFVEKLALVQSAYPRDTAIRFIAGYDTLVRILDPKYYENANASLRSLFAGAHVMVATRGHVDIHGIRRFLLSDAHRSFSDRIVPFEIDPAMGSVSSTSARGAICASRQTVDILSPEVSSYIQRRGLYKRPAED